MKNILLVLYVLSGVLFCYGNITDNIFLITIGIFSIVPCIAIYYLLTAKKKNFIYLIALIAAYIGDVTFFNKQNISIDLVSLGGFIIFNLLIMIIVSEKMKLVKFRKILFITPILVSIFLAITYYVFKTVDQIFFAIGIYFLSLSLLTSFCIVYYRKTKSKNSLFFLVGVTSYIVASISKEFQYINSATNLLFLINTLAYLSTQYFYCKAMLKSE